MIFNKKRSRMKQAKLGFFLITAIVCLTSKADEHDERMMNIDDFSAEHCLNGGDLPEDTMRSWQAFTEILNDQKTREFFASLPSKDQRLCMKLFGQLRLLVMNLEKDISGLLGQPEYQSVLSALKKFANISNIELRLELRDVK
jgi:hypothetical protein